MKTGRYKALVAQYAFLAALKELMLKSICFVYAKVWDPKLFSRVGFDKYQQAPGMGAGGFCDLDRFYVVWEGRLVQLKSSGIHTEQGGFVASMLNPKAEMVDGNSVIKRWAATPIGEQMFHLGIVNPTYIVRVKEGERRDKKGCWEKTQLISIYKVPRKAAKAFFSAKTLAAIERMKQEK